MQIPSVVPPTVIKLLMHEPRDIALAIQVTDVLKEDDAEAGDMEPGEPWRGLSVQGGDLEDMFEEVGLELVKEAREPEDDDDRRKS